MPPELWRARWLNCINDLTCLPLQQASWLDRTTSNPHWSFVEFMCKYFDDLILEEGYSYAIEEGWVSKEEVACIQHWHDLLDQYQAPNQNNHDRAAILADKQWQLIVQVGLEATQKLTCFLTPEEIEILTEETDYTNYL